MEGSIRLPEGVEAPAPRPTPDCPDTLRALRVRIDRNREARGIRLKDLYSWASGMFGRVITDLGQMTAGELRRVIKERGL